MKMRIIWFQQKRWTLLFLCLSEILLSVSVSSSTAQEEVLNGAVGESITFSTQVPVSGTISYEGRIIGQVFNKQTDTDSDEKFRSRLHWNNQSGLFTLSDLRTNDSGVYTVQSTKEEKRKQDYQLDVYDKVSAPQLKNATYNSSECVLLCSVRSVRGLNLSWFKGSVLLNHTNSSSTDDILYLSLEIKKLDKDPYSCIASNPVSKQNTTVNISEHCPHVHEPQDHRSYTLAIVVPVICLLLLAVIVMTIYLRRTKLRKEISQHTEGRAIYANIHRKRMS